ncbi:MAG: hypothetical protein H6R07_3256 [Proteobacteria bacterium]|nr:hypothetical protein [Pseudomonadota bacterium]
MEQIKNILAAVQRGTPIHPTELAQAQAELARAEKLFQKVARYTAKHEESAEANGFLWLLSHR